jgi:hypothetical protein
MAISSLGVTSRTIIQATLTNGGVHLFTTGSLTGLLSVKATNTITVVLGRSTASNGTLSAQSGVNFTVGADNFDTVLVYGNIGDELVIDFTPVTTSTATTSPSWLSLAGYTWTGNTYVAQPTKILYPVDTVSVSTALPSGRVYSAGFSNSGVAGYLAGGYTAAAGTAVTSIDQYVFPTDTPSTITPVMAATRYFHAAYANSGVAGYVTNGFYNGVFGTNATIIDKFAFPTMTRSTSAATSLQRVYSGACADGHDSGYIFQGSSNNAAGGGNSSVRRHYFSTDVAVTASGGTSYGADYYHYAAFGSHHGYGAVYVPGTDFATTGTPSTSSIGFFAYSYTYANTTQNVLTASMYKPVALTWPGHGSGGVNTNSGLCTYFSGGRNASHTNVQHIDKMDFPSATMKSVNLVTGVAAAPGYHNYNSSFDNIGVF